MLFGNFNRRIQKVQRDFSGRRFFYFWYYYFNTGLPGVR